LINLLLFLSLALARPLDLAHPIAETLSGLVIIGRLCALHGFRTVLIVMSFMTLEAASAAAALALRGADALGETTRARG
jgi:hypothetical protein